jgi:DNA-binding MarR family transcriptional regulator
MLVGHLVGLAHLRAKELCLKLLDPLALTPKQFVALEFISRNPGISQKEISGHIGTTPTVMVSILDTLTEHGFVERVTDSKDRRRSHVRVTRKGSDNLEDIKRLAFEVESIMRDESGMNHQEWQTLLALLRKLTHRANLYSSEVI